MTLGGSIELQARHKSWYLLEPLSNDGGRMYCNARWFSFVGKEWDTPFVG